MSSGQPFYMRAFMFIMDVWTTAADRYISVVAAGVAFFGMFAIFPAIAGTLRAAQMRAAISSAARVPSS